MTTCVEADEDEAARQVAVFAVGSVFVKPTHI